MVTNRLTDWLTLMAVPGIGARRANMLLTRFGTPEKILNLSAEHLCKTGSIPQQIAAKIEGARQRYYDQVQLELELIQTHGCVALTLHDENYPKQLRHIPDPPPVLYVKGTLAVTDILSVAIVGTRSPSSYGLSLSEQLASQLVEAGLTIVSGLAQGVDGFAHRGALLKKGRTIAVLGNGLAQCYPPQHQDLFDTIAKTGAVVSELPMATTPSKQTFPARNRIISGFSLGVVVIEAPIKSGALITAKHALDQNREVFAVPGQVGQPSSEGTNALIKQGARLVQSTDDILDELDALIASYRNEYQLSAAPNPMPIEPLEALPTASVKKPSARKTKEPASKSNPARQNTQPAERAPEKVREPLPPANLSDEEQQVWDLLCQTPVHVDELCHRCSLNLPTLNRVLLQLEFKQAVQRCPGNQFIRC